MFEFICKCWCRWDGVGDVAGDGGELSEVREAEIEINDVQSLLVLYKSIFIYKYKSANCSHRDDQPKIGNARNK